MSAQHTPEKIAPVQGYTPGIPWSLHIEAYDAYRKKYGDQPALIDLEGRGCRGGFGTRELDDFIPGWRDKVSELARIKGQRDELLAAAQATLAKNLHLADGDNCTLIDLKRAVERITGCRNERAAHTGAMAL